MADYATLLRDHTTLDVPVGGPVLLAGVCAQAAVGGAGVPVLALAAAVPDPLVGGVRQDRRRLCARTSIASPRSTGSRWCISRRGESKEAEARPLIDAAAAEGGDGKVVLIGIAQERASVWRSWPAKGQEKARHPHMEWGRQMAFVNHFYFYIWDPEWGPAFIKTNAYAPWPIWIYLNGHEWAKRQCDKAGIGYQALDNGFRSCAGPEETAADLRPAGLGSGAQLLLAVVPPPPLAVHPLRPAPRLHL